MGFLMLPHPLTNFEIQRYYQNEPRFNGVFSRNNLPEKIKDFNVLIDGKSFFDVLVKNKEEAYEKIRSIDKNNDYTTGNLLNYEYFSKHCKLIAINLSKQTELENPDLRQQINFIGKLENDRKSWHWKRLGWGICNKP